MAEVVITVRGEAESRHAPERVRVRLSVELEDRSRDAAIAAATHTAATLRQQLAALHADGAGPVTSWQAGQLHVWSQPQWRGEGQRPESMHHVNIAFVAEFADFGALSAWLDDVLPVPGVSVAGLDWSLTPEREAEVLAEVRERAVRDAQAKAAALAASLGLDAPRPVAIADAGMLDGSGGTGAPEAPRPMALLASSARGVSAELSFTPADLTVSCAVDARFVAGEAAAGR